ncbi:MAG: hypothetical protein HY094_10525 [Candidatus Melainabacteria bacterium]|nr:hypothetical protein [Candidatus Melainabacteria bacterium]
MPEITSNPTPVSYADKISQYIRERDESSIQTFKTLLEAFGGIDPVKFSSLISLLQAASKKNDPYKTALLTAQLKILTTKANIPQEELEKLITRISGPGTFVEKLKQAVLPKSSSDSRANNPTTKNSSSGLEPLNYRAQFEAQKRRQAQDEEAAF